MPRGAEPVKRILVATDRSESANRAVYWAADMAGRYDAQLVILQILLPQDGSDAADASRAQAAGAELARWVEAEFGSRGRALIEVDDDPAMAICDVAANEDTDVVVVGNVGMAGRKEFLLGNVANRVSHNAPCTVVIVNTAGAKGEGRIGRIFKRKS